jgi:hypothetical protein
MPFFEEAISAQAMPLLHLVLFIQCQLFIMEYHYRFWEAVFVFHVESPDQSSDTCCNQPF